MNGICRTLKAVDMFIVSFVTLLVGLVFVVDGVIRDGALRWKPRSHDGGFTLEIKFDLFLDYKFKTIVKILNHKQNTFSVNYFSVSVDRSRLTLLANHRLPTYFPETPPKPLMAFAIATQLSHPFWHNVTCRAGQEAFGT